MKRILACAMAVLFTGTTSLWAESGAGGEYDLGKRFYQDKCRFCHGIKGNGKGPASEPLFGHPVDFTDPDFWRNNIDKKIADTIRNGKEMMPAFDLKQAEIKAIIYYMSHTFKKNITGPARD